MEIVGIILSIPMAFITSSIYSILIKKIINKWKPLAKPVFWISALILSLVCLEFLGVIIMGTLTLRQELGQLYYPIHSCLFILTLPSLVNIMVIQKRIHFLSKWYTIGVICALFGLSVVILQYSVSETLYGIDGTSGPYSHKSK